MRFWRIVRRQDRSGAFSGEGARIWGGRWNPPGLPMVYASEHLSLAVLEVLVNLDDELKRERFLCFPGEIPEGLPVASIAVADLQGDWRSSTRSERLQTLGARWLTAGESVALSVPSAVVPQERNILLNPAHPDFARIAIGEPEPFSFDPRLLPPPG